MGRYQDHDVGGIKTMETFIMRGEIVGNDRRKSPLRHLSGRVRGYNGLTHFLTDFIIDALSSEVSFTHVALPLQTYSSH